MKKVRLGICIGDLDYRERFCGCLMNHYREQFEFYIYSSGIQIQNQELDVLVIGDMKSEEYEMIRKNQPVIYLQEGEELPLEGVIIVDKYQEVNKIVEEILRNVGDEVKQVKEDLGVYRNTHIYGVYSLSQTEFQLPFSLTMGSILGENSKVLLVDLQEHSGFSHFIGGKEEKGIDDLFVMTQMGSFSKSRMNACIGHLEHMDYVYPAVNQEFLSEIDVDQFWDAMKIIAGEKVYDVIVLSFGSQFRGFHEIVNRCEEFFLIGKKGGICQWREAEFNQELEDRGHLDCVERMHRVELPIFSENYISYERLIEQWKWNEFGDGIRQMIPRRAMVG